MSKVIADITTSLDAYVTGPRGDVDELHAWTPWRDHVGERCKLPVRTTADAYPGAPGGGGGNRVRRGTRAMDLAMAYSWYAAERSRSSRLPRRAGLRLFSAGHRSVNPAREVRVTSGRFYRERLLR